MNAPASRSGRWAEAYDSYVSMPPATLDGVFRLHPRIQLTKRMPESDLAFTAQGDSEGARYLRLVRNRWGRGQKRLMTVREAQLVVFEYVIDEEERASVPGTYLAYMAPIVVLIDGYP